MAKLLPEVVAHRFYGADTSSQFVVFSIMKADKTCLASLEKSGQLFGVGQVLGAKEGSNNPAAQSWKLFEFDPAEFFHTSKLANRELKVKS